MQFRDHIYHLTPEGGEKLLQETHEQLDAAKARLVSVSKQKAKAMQRYDEELKRIRDEIRGYTDVIKMVEDTVFGGEYSELGHQEIQQIINDDSVPF